MATKKKKAFNIYSPYANEEQERVSTALREMQRAYAATDDSDLKKEIEKSWDILVDIQDMIEQSLEKEDSDEEH